VSATQSTDRITREETTVKKKIAIGGVGGFLLGVLVAGLLGWFMMPGLMMNESVSALGFDETVQAIQDGAAAEDWAVPSVARLDESLKKSGFEVGPVAVIELCKPDLANDILSDDDARIVSSLMPCRVAVYEKADGEVVVSRMNTALMSKMFGGLVAATMSEATAQTEQIFAPLEK
jgi:uncharacterized protein (DUF302 family)